MRKKRNFTLYSHRQYKKWLFGSFNYMYFRNKCLKFVSYAVAAAAERKVGQMG